MKRIVIVLCLLTFLCGFNLKADDTVIPTTEIIIVVKEKPDTKNRPHAPSRPLTCEYSEGLLTFCLQGSQILNVSVEHIESGVTYQKTVTGSDRSIYIGTLPGSYNITATTDENRTYSGVLQIN